MKSTIAVIGAEGRVGEAIARRLSGAGYPLLLMCEGCEKLNALAADLGAKGMTVEVISCAREAAWEADIIVTAVAFDLLGEVAATIREVSVGKLVMAAPADGSSDDAARMLQQLLPHSKVISALACDDANAVSIIREALHDANQWEYRSTITES